MTIYFDKDKSTEIFKGLAEYYIPFRYKGYSGKHMIFITKKNITINIHVLNKLGLF